MNVQIQRVDSDVSTTDPIEMLTLETDALLLDDACADHVNSLVVGELDDWRKAVGDMLTMCRALDYDHDRCQQEREVKEGKLAHSGAELERLQGEIRLLEVELQLMRHSLAMNQPPAASTSPPPPSTSRRK